jgi:hypothetical protein
VSITSNEYTALQSNVPSTSVCVSSKTLLDAATSNNLNQGPILATNTSNATDSRPIPSSNYIYAAAFRYGGAGDTLQLYNNTNIAINSNFSAVGGAFPTSVNGYNYAILKGGSAKTGANESYAAILSPGSTGVVNKIAYKNVVATPILTGGSTNIRYSAPNAPLTVTSSTSVASVLSNSVLGIQVLATPSNVW